MRTKLKPCFIFSAEKSIFDGVLNARRTQFVENNLIENKTNYKKLSGAYQGVDGSSFLVLNIDDAVNYAKLYDQDSILCIDENRNVEIYNLKTDLFEKLGKLHSSSVRPALKNYTYDDQSKTYYYTI